MKKKTILVMIVFVLTAAILPIRSYACGGFVAIWGSKEYHSIYCDLIEGADFGELRWFDTSEQAKASGLNSCSKCEQYADWDFECSYYDPYWKTDDHLLWSAMEMEYDIGSENGEENGYEIGYGDGQTGYEFSLHDYYDLGYDEGYEVGKENGYDFGYDDGLNAGKENGYDDGYRIGYEEGRESKMPSAISLLLLIGVLCVVAYCFGKQSKKYDLEEELKKYKIDNTKLMAALNQQKYAMYVLNLIAERCDYSTENLVDSLFIHFLKGAGHTEEEARAQLQAKKQGYLNNK